MGEYVSVEEILEFAIAREIEANQFYMNLAKQVENPAMRRVFEDFAGEELEHKAKLELEAMKEGIVMVPMEKAAGFQMADYMSDVEVSTDMYYKDVLILAMNKEKRSLRLYVDLAAIVEDANSRETLLSLAVEEAKHHARFEIEYDEIVLKGS
ncbi:MAG: ferritin family protein [Planctomycetota bacterium]|jgi:rubrerythrin